jgi:hypothetical protein
VNAIHALSQLSYGPMHGSGGGYATPEREEEVLLQPSRYAVKLTMMVSLPRSLTQAPQQVLRQAALDGSGLHGQDRGHTRSIAYCAVQAFGYSVLK